MLKRGSETEKGLQLLLDGTAQRAHNTSGKTLRRLDRCGKWKLCMVCVNVVSGRVVFVEGFLYVVDELASFLLMRRHCYTRRLACLGRLELAERTSGASDADA